MKINPITTPVSQNVSRYLKSLSKEHLAADFPLGNIDLSKVEGIQKDIPLFFNSTMQEIKFLTKNFSVLNIAQGCNSECSHCLRNAKRPSAQSTILWDDLERFTGGVEALNERLGFDIFQGNNYLVLHDDFNPPEVLLKDANGSSYNFADALKLVFKKLHIPIETVTSGWNKSDSVSEKAAADVVDFFQKMPEANALTSISVNPFHGILEKSRKLARDGNPEMARFWREVYTDRIAHAIETFLPVFKEGKASLIYRHAGGDFAKTDVGAKETANLYREIYQKLAKRLGNSFTEIEDLKPEKFEEELPVRFIEAKGRGRRYFSAQENFEKQKNLISEKNKWETSSPGERAKNAYDYTIKEVDIRGNVYGGTLSESLIKTDIQLNYKNKDVPSIPLYSDIKLSPLSKQEIIENL